VCGRSAGGAALLLPDGDAPGPEYYESARTRDEYLALHYPDGDPLVPFLGEATPPLAARYPLGVSRYWAQEPQGLALDAGCACGRMTLELARDLGQAVGLDRSVTLVDAGRAAWASGEASYRRAVEGEITEDVTAPLGVTAGVTGRAELVVGDALALPFPRGAFGVVTALNLLDRVPDPGRLLVELTRVTAAGGLLVIGSPYTWLTEFTPRERWIGGLVTDGAPVHGADAVHTALADGFDREAEASMPFFIPHHARSGQLGRAHVQVFRRRA
jgi:SAM-dependent methyltransferase